MLAPVSGKSAAPPGVLAAVPAALAGPSAGVRPVQSEALAVVPEAKSEALAVVPEARAEAAELPAAWAAVPAAGSGFDPARSPHRSSVGLRPAAPLVLSNWLGPSQRPGTRSRAQAIRSVSRHTPSVASFCQAGDLVLSPIRWNPRRQSPSTTAHPMDSEMVI